MIVIFAYRFLYFHPDYVFIFIFALRSLLPLVQAGIELFWLNNLIEDIDSICLKVTVAFPNPTEIFTIPLIEAVSLVPTLTTAIASLQPVIELQEAKLSPLTCYINIGVFDICNGSVAYLEIFVALLDERVYIGVFIDHVFKLEVDGHFRPPVERAID